MQILAEKPCWPSESCGSRLVLRENQKYSVMLCKSKANTSCSAALEIKATLEGNNILAWFTNTSGWPQTCKSFLHKSALVTLEDTACTVSAGWNRDVHGTSALDGAAFPLPCNTQLPTTLSLCFMSTTYDAEGPPKSLDCHVVWHRALLCWLSI